MKTNWSLYYLPYLIVGSLNIILIVVFAVLFLTGCGNQETPPQDPRNISGINPVFNSYVTQFESYLHRSIGDIPIQFVPQSGDAIGQCIVWDNQWREIEIDPYFWNNEALDDDQRTSLLFHELGHCVLNRGHLDTTTSSVLTSWMNYYIFFNAEYPATEASYINELFNPAPGDPTLGYSVGGPEDNDDDFVHINR